MHAFRAVMLALPFAVPLHARALSAGGDDRALRHVQGHVVIAEIRIKLRLGVKGEVRKRAVRLEARKLREPLSHEMKISRVAGAQHDRGQLGAELERERQGITGRNRTR